MRSLLMMLAVAIALGALVAAENRRRNVSSTSPHFTGLGDLHGGMTFSVAEGVSADGTSVVGYSHSSSGPEAFRWTPAEGILALGFQHASAVSADGSVVGYRLVDGRVVPARWTSGGVVETLETFDGDRSGAACGISANGSTIVGAVETHNLDLGECDTAFQWTADERVALRQRPEEAVARSEAHAVSADGAVVVGAFRRPAGHDEAFRWTAEFGTVGLGFLPGHYTSVAYAVSADGSVVVGCSSDYTTNEAFRWTREIGMVSLGSLSKSAGDSVAHGVSADGSIIVGHSAGETGWDAFIWDADRGMRSIRQLLESDFHLGGTLRGWKLRSAMAVSADGTTVVGFGINRHGDQEGWLARLADPPISVTPKPAFENAEAAGIWWSSYGHRNVPR